MLTFTIVTPSFNQARFIRETIESVLSQDYPRVAYIVRDGGSTDGTRDILRAYGDRLTWVSEPDAGQADAINKGFADATGDALAWLNADDAYEPGALRAVAGFFQANPTVGLVYGDIVHVGTAGQFLKHRSAPLFDRDALLRHCFIPQPAAFFRREVWQAVGGLDARLHYAMDWDLWLRMAQKTEVRKLPATLARFRWHGQSKTFALGCAAAREAIYDVRRRHRPAAPFVDARDYLAGALRAVVRSLLFRAREAGGAVTRRRRG
ncbi:MAG: glycosyltransferase [Anaerolineae bacterium]|nr:glycosyltransferase [Anaerolineae bacterium]